MLRKLFIVVLLVGTSHTAFSQSFSDDTTVIKTALNLPAGDSMLYLKHSVGWIYMRECLKLENIRRKNIEGPNGIFFSKKADLKNLRQQIKQLADTEWPDSIFSHAIRVVDTDIWKYFDQKKEEFAERQKAATKNKDWDALRKMQHEENWVYGFSKPIYLMNGTMCLLYTQALCGHTCGRNEVAFYMKQNGTWLKYLVIGEGAF